VAIKLYRKSNGAVGGWDPVGKTLMAAPSQEEFEKCCCCPCPADVVEEGNEFLECDCTPRYMSLKLRDADEAVNGDWCLEASEAPINYFWNLIDGNRRFIVAVNGANFYIFVRSWDVSPTVYYFDAYVARNESDCEEKHADIPNELEGKTGTATIQGCC